MDVRRHDDEGMLEIQGEQKYPYVWLRDNCRCPECYAPSSNERLLRMQQLDIAIIPSQVKVTDSGVAITWPDDHISEFDSSWLKEHGFQHEQIEKRITREIVKPNLWGSELQGNIPTVDFNKLMCDDSALYQWLVDLEGVGLHLICNAPGQGSVDQIGKRVAHLRNNNYGTVFQVRTKEDPSNVAYTSASLGLHTDLPQYNYVPGMQMLHCISQTPTIGGENEFVDGFKVAHQMASQYPHHYSILTSVPVVYYDIGEDQYSFHLRYPRPTIRIKETGEVESINYNNQVRHTGLDIPLSDVKPLYAALKAFDDLCYHPDNCVRYKLQAGEIACFHNYRVLHGRQGYQATGSGGRHLEGGYLDWDELKSRRRVLQDKLA